MHLPAHATVLVADVHLGKARTFRRLGLPVPDGTTQDTLQRLAALVADTRARRIVVLGDLLHSRHAQGSPAMAALADFRAAHPSLAMTLVRGNHDDHAGDPPVSLGIEVVDEPFALGGLALCHDPHLDAARPRVGGHVHPAIRVRGRGFDAVRLPCFHLEASSLTLPAFGAFTGTHAVRPAEGDRVWALVDDRVVEIGG